jgi:hypothetical protein
MFEPGAQDPPVKPAHRYQLTQPGAFSSPAWPLSTPGYPADLAAQGPHPGTARPNSRGAGDRRR